MSQGNMHNIRTCYLSGPWLSRKTKHNGMMLEIGMISAIEGGVSMISF